MRLLNIVVSCELPGYLGNALKSLKQLLPIGDTLVIENGRDLDRTKAVIKDAMPDAVLLGRGENRADRKVGSLYEAYNEGIEYGLERGYDLLHFIQDDMQWMWYRAGMMERIAEILQSNPSISMVLPLFQKEIVATDFRRRAVPRPDLGTWEIDYGVADIGIMAAAFIRKTGFRFGSTEGEHSARVLKMGGRAHVLAAPMISFVPWPAVRRGGQLVGPDLPLDGSLFLKPLNESQIDRLLAAAKSFDVVCADEYCLPSQGKVLWPYWFTECTPEYLSRVFRWWRQTGKRPRWVGSGAGRARRPTPKQASAILATPLGFRLLDAIRRHGMAGVLTRLFK